MNYWLMKSEPSVYSIDDLKRDGFSGWEGVRNYQARNYMRDSMKIGDLALFYHSNSKPPGVAGICRICSKPHPDPTAFDEKSPYYDPKSKSDKPVWFMVEVEFVEKFENILPLNTIKSVSALDGLVLIKKGSRLSIQPVSLKHFDIIVKMGRNQ